MNRGPVVSALTVLAIGTLLLGCSAQPSAPTGSSAKQEVALSSQQTIMEPPTTAAETSDAEQTTVEVTDPNSVSDPSQVCQLEAVNVSLSRLNDSSGVLHAIGAQSPHWGFGNELMGTYVREKARSGETAAGEALWPVAEAACTEAGNPVLTRGQVEGMYRLTGWKVFNTISYFGPDDATASTTEDSTRILTDPAEVCRAEALNVAVAAAEDSGGVANATGTRSELVRLAYRLIAPYGAKRAEVGADAAVEAMWPIAEQACAEANNPVLTSGQVQEMYRLTGWSVFQQIGYFGN